MRFIARKVSSAPRALYLELLLLLAAGSLAPLLGQTAPYILPYTMSTFAGPHAAYTVGAACGNLVALDTTGDGCLASQASIGADPHDIRVDGKGNVYWQDDNGSYGVIHKIDPYTMLETVAAGSVSNTKVCAGADEYGDNCTATDGAANVGTTNTGHLSKGRGLGVANNGDLFFAGYNDDLDQKVTAATGTEAQTNAGIFSIVAGTYAGTTAVAGDADGPVGTGKVNDTRGIGVDSSTGNLFVADTGNNILREVVNGTMSTITAAGGTANAVKNDQPAISEVLDEPEDAQVDSNGNVYSAIEADAIIVAIYNGKGTLPGISNPTTGNMYIVAGNPTPLSTATGTLNTTYPSDGTTPVVPATSVNIGVRKMGLDSLNNLYIADSSNNVVWFVDHATGGMRLLAGRFQPSPVGATTVPAPVPYGCAASTDSVGDGCPGPDASLYSSSDMGTDPDNQGNLYITDAEDGVAANSRLRKLLSGLNFPAVAVTGGTPVTQSLMVHFAVGDTPAAANPFTVTGKDYAVGAPACGSANSDGTTDCIVPVTFTPTLPGYDTAMLTIASALGGVNSYLLTGTGTAPSIAFDPGSAAILTSSVGNPQGVVLDGVGNAYIADTADNQVLFYSAANATTTVFAGTTGTAGYSGDGGAATSATLSAPKAVAIDTSGNVYIADSGNNVIRKVNAAGIISTFAGGAQTVCSQSTDSFGDGCPATQATFSAPSGLAADNLGQVYVSDTGNNLVRQINVLGNVSVLAGGAASASCTTAGADSYGNGCSGRQATFSAPAGLAYDAAGNEVIVADAGDNMVREISTVPNSFTVTAGAATNILFNAVTLIAGNGQPGDSLDQSLIAAKSQLNGPLGVAVDAAENVYIADSGNDAVRLVSHAAGTISTIVGINLANGTGTVPGPATSAQLTTPAGVAVSPTGLLYVADSGNNRVLTDARSQASFDFGRILPGASSQSVSFTETSIGTSGTTLPSPLYTASGDTTQFTLTEPTGSTGCTAGESLAPGASCIFQAQFSPSADGNYTATYTETGTVSAGGTPSITLIGTGFQVTPTTSTVSQGANSEYGGPVTLTATVTASSSNPDAPTTYPSGTVSIVVDGTAGAPEPLTGTAGSTSSQASQTLTGLSVGTHTVSCNYGGDGYYSSSTCVQGSVTVTQANTTSTLVAGPNNQPQFPLTNCAIINDSSSPYNKDNQCTATTLVATVVSNTSGLPTGSVNFYANGNLLGTVALGSTTGVASLALTTIYDSNYNLVVDTTLAPGTYSLTCTYSGSTNFSGSACPAVSLTIVASPPSFTLTPVGCAAVNLLEPGTSVAGEGEPCSSGSTLANANPPVVATAQGSTTDATIFINETNTATGTLTFACSGMPAATTCTFSPVSITLTPTPGVVPVPVYTDVTFWTDLQPGSVTSSSATPSLRASAIGHGRNGMALAMIFGWPVTLAGLFGLIRLRRRPGTVRGLSLLAMVLVMAGTSLIFTGCGGPGAYKPVLTPAGTYPITITVTNGTTSETTVIDFTVAAPGITGEE